MAAVIQQSKCQRSNYVREISFMTTPIGSTADDAADLELRVEVVSRWSRGRETDSSGARRNLSSAGYRCWASLRVPNSTATDRLNWRWFVWHARFRPMIFGTRSPHVFPPPRPSPEGGRRPIENRVALTGKLHTDMAYDAKPRRQECRARGIVPRIARKGIESSEQFGRHRWILERTRAWVNCFRRLPVRYERRSVIYVAFTSHTASLITFNQIRRLC